jgi:ribosomal-protein-alanine N-acetyltransferase
MKKYKSYETERLLLKPTSEEDAEFIFKLLNTPKWLQYIGDRKVYSVEDAKKYIEAKIQPQLERLGYANYTLIRKRENDKIGACGLYDREGLDGIDIGFAFLPEYEGKGYAFEASNKLKQVAFDELGITEINAITTKDNVSSQKLLEKLGLHQIGTTTISDDSEELLLFQIRKEN